MPVTHQGTIRAVAALLLIAAVSQSVYTALYIAKLFEDHDGVTIDAGLDLSGIVLVVVLFILARVFRHGAAMRADLEGTV